MFLVFYLISCAFIGFACFIWWRSFTAPKRTPLRFWLLLFAAFCVWNLVILAGFGAIYWFMFPAVPIPSQ